MLPGVYNFKKMYRGDNFKGHVFQMRKIDNSEFDLTGVSVLMQVRPFDISDEDPVIQWSTDDETIIVSGGDITILERSAFDMNIKGRDYAYDVQLTWEDGYVETPVMGIFPIVNDTSRRSI